MSEWTTDDWVRKLKHQADDSKVYRHKLYEKVDLKNKKKILDVGCGTGAVLYDMAHQTDGKLIGIDIDKEKLDQAKGLLKDLKNVELMEADTLDLPFEDESFDLVTFTIVLIYISDQQKAIDEMVRVTKKGGIVLATLEPDYEARIDYPENPVAPLFLKQMIDLGADIRCGRKLKVLFTKAGLKTEVGMDTECGFPYSKDDENLAKKFEELFWVYEKLFIKEGWSKDKIRQYREEELKMIKEGMNFKFAPGFYAIGKKL